ncbi:MAG: SusC/RagA family TonB-linked outer membrane protein [Flavisolibacter sp.]
MKKRLLLAWVLALCALPSLLFAQTKQVTGTVTDDGGKPLSSVSVMQKGNSFGTTTDAQGRYSLSNVSETATLIFSSVGFQTVEVGVNGRSVVNATLQPDAQALDEVIAVAYGTSKKGTFTGSASVINERDIKEIPTTSFQNALIGKAAGVQVTSASGQAGAVSSIRIRGIGSMNASNEPLYVVDGVPITSGNTGQLSDYIYSTNNVMNTLNPADIESITILKDAAAASLYGSRAANGVVVITTKKGRSGRPKINLRSSIGITPSWATDNYEAADVQAQVNMLYQIFHDYRTSNGRTEAYANQDALNRLNTKFNKHGYRFETAGTGRYENVMIKGMTDGMENREGRYFDWEDALFRTGVYQTNDLSVSGGDQNTKYYSSFSYTKDNSRIKVNNFDRISGRVNLTQAIGKYVDFISNINIAKTNKSGYNDTRNTGGNYFMQTRNLLWPLYWPTDYKTGKPYTARLGSLAYNNVYYDNEWENNTSDFRMLANQSAVLHILPSLDLKSIFSYDNVNTKDHLYYSANHFSGSASNGYVSEMSTNSTRLVSSTTLNYKKMFGAHNVDALVGYEAEKNNTDFQRATGTDLPSSALHTVATAGELDANAYSWGNTMNSVLSRLEYNYDQKYFASASYRRDGSSKLGPDTRWGDFWSIAGAWSINREAFMDAATYFSNLRLRASYGINGTLPPADFGWRPLAGYSNQYMEQAGGGISTIADRNLQWETNYVTNVGLDFGLFAQRVYGTIEYFNRDSRNLLQYVPISRVTGFSSTLRNVGEMNNHGLELSLGGDIVRKNKMRWSVNANASFIKSEVTKLYATPGEEKGNDIIWYDPTGGDARAQYIYREGESTYSFYGYEWAGVDPSNGKNRYFVNDPGDKTAGDFLLDGRGATYDWAKANYTIIGSAIPDFYGGFGTDFEYGNFNISANFIYKVGGNLYDGAFKDMADDGYYWERIRSEIYYENMWTDANPNGNLPKLDGNDLTDPMKFSTRQMHDATFLRLKNLSLGYNLPASVLRKVGIGSARIYANGTNLLTFSKYKIADPEVNNYGTRGWETPFGKTYTFGIELSF